MKEFASNIVNIFTSQEKNIRILIGFVIFIILALFSKQIAKLILNILARIFLFKKEHFKQPFKDSLQKPLSVFFIILGLFIFTYIIFTKPAIVEIFKISCILIICWSIVNYLSNNLFLLFHFGENANDVTNTTFIRFISNILKIVVIAFAVVMVISELGYNINGLLTGLGVGGLAVSLASQEAVSNLISGFIIVFEKPFIVGDLISTSEIKGFVEEVQMRSTTIRTLEDTVVTVPNSKLTSNAITNLSRMNKRLISFTIGLEYSTSNDTMLKCSKDIEQYMIDNENILPSPIRINFKEFENSSLDFSIECYTIKTDVNEYMQVCSDLNYKIKEIVENNGAKFAFPSTSVYLKKDV